MFFRTQSPYLNLLRRFRPSMQRLLNMCLMLLNRLNSINSGNICYLLNWFSLQKKIDMLMHNCRICCSSLEELILNMIAKISLPQFLELLPARGDLPTMKRMTWMFHWWRSRGESKLRRNSARGSLVVPLLMICFLNSRTYVFNPSQLMIILSFLDQL